MKRIIVAWALCLSLLIAGCSEPYVDSEKIYTVTFFPNGGVASVTSMETDARGRLASLPTATRDDDINPDTWEPRSYSLAGWFTTGGSEITLKTVFHADTFVVARWRASDEPGTEQPGPLALWLASLPAGDPAPVFEVKADEKIKPQTLANGGRQITVTVRGILPAASGDVSSEPPSLSLSGLGAFFTVENGVTLILEDIRLAGKRNNSSLIVVNPGGKLIIRKGTVITGNVNEVKNFGGGVTVNMGGEFIMEGGQIVENVSIDVLESSLTATSGGGGVLVRGGTFTMTGGQITKNEAYNGAGVLVNRGGVFIMGPFAEKAADKPYEDPIFEYQIYKNLSSEGGGVKVIGGRIDDDPTSVSSRFVMKGGKIHDNSGTGGVAASSRGIFSMYDGEISKNTGSDVGGVMVRLGTVYMYGGKITNNKGTWSTGGVYNYGRFYMFGGEISLNYGGNAGGVNNRIPPVTGLGGFFYMWGGDIYGNTGDSSAGGVINNAFFYMHGGSIRGNTNNLGKGGGLINGDAADDEQGLFVVTGGVIYGYLEPNNFPANLTWNDYMNVEKIGSHSGSAFHVVGGLVAWGRKGYYDLDAGNNIKFIPDTRYTEPKKTDPGYGEPGYEDGKIFRAEIAVGWPEIDYLYWGVDGDGEDKYIPVIKMNESRVKQETSILTFEVKDDGVYIDGDLALDFAVDLPN